MNNGGENLISGYFIEDSAATCKELSVDELKKKLLMASAMIFDDVMNSDKYYNVLCHGDLCGRNVLANKNTDSFVIDFQL